jgi:hypothetical protein
LVAFSADNSAVEPDKDCPPLLRFIQACVLFFM